MRLSLGEENNGFDVSDTLKANVQKIKNKFHRIWDYPIKEQYASILMSIEGTKPLPNASEGFRIVNEREGNDFAFIHDAQEIKYEIARFEDFFYSKNEAF